MDITTNDNNVISTVHTDGYLLLYIDGNKVKMTGNLDIKALTPLVTKVLMEKMLH